MDALRYMLNNQKDNHNVKIYFISFRKDGIAFKCIEWKHRHNQVQLEIVVWIMWIMHTVVTCLNFVEVFHSWPIPSLTISDIGNTFPHLNWIIKVTNIEYFLSLRHWQPGYLPNYNSGTNSTSQAFPCYLYIMVSPITYNFHVVTSNMKLLFNAFHLSVSIILSMGTFLNF